MSDPRAIEGLEAGDERQQEEAAQAEQDKINAYADAMSRRDRDSNDPRNWPASYDMRGYTDAPTVSQGMVRSKERI